MRLWWQLFQNPRYQGKARQNERKMKRRSWLIWIICISVKIFYCSKVIDNWPPYIEETICSILLIIFPIWGQQKQPEETGRKLGWSRTVGLIFCYFRAVASLIPSRVLHLHPLHVFPGQILIKIPSVVPPLLHGRTFPWVPSLNTRHDVHQQPLILFVLLQNDVLHCLALASKITSTVLNSQSYSEALCTSWVPYLHCRCYVVAGLSGMPGWSSIISSF